MRARAVCRILLIPVLLGAAGGCATVEPWERGVLARPDMSLDPQPRWSQLRDHAHVSREAAQGGHGAAGGGCGCN